MHQCWVSVILGLLLAAPFLAVESHLCSNFIEPGDFEKFDLDDLNDWLKQQLQKVTTFCNEGEPDPNLPEDRTSFSVFDPVSSADCDKSKTLWSGKLEKDGLPKGPGLLKWKTGRSQDEPQDPNVINSKGNSCCLNLKEGIAFFSGRFSRGGTPTGKGRIEFEHDQHTMEGNTFQGKFHGKVTQQSRTGDLNYVGTFEYGLAHGPGWIFSHEPQRDGMVFLWFDQGKAVTHPTVYLSGDGKMWMGTLTNSSVLVNAKEIQIKRAADYKCVLVLDVTTAKIAANSPTIPKLRLPVVIRTFPKLGRVLVRNGKTLIFNRIAKTGSQSITELLMQLKKRNGIKLEVVLRQVEYLLEPPQMVSSFVEQIDGTSEAKAWVRHYNFFDMTEYGARWNPIYINMVRDPVDRVISYFYYRRAAWNIVERKMAYPNDPLPNPDFLRKDFDTCVLEGDSECVYQSGSNILEHDDHRSQVMAFCGHDWFCTEFNSREALNRAKENVEKFYSVVGVLERMNDTLAVMEAELPAIFSGAQSTYYGAQEIKRKQMRNAYKLPVSEKVMELVRANFTQEIEFYEFCRARLQKQKELLVGGSH